MSILTWTYITVGLSFALYIGVAIWSRASSTSSFYVAGRGVPAFANGMATAADWMSAPLQRIQVVKGWIDAAGETHERVRDVVCADGLEVDQNTLRCPDNGAAVDITSCQTLGERGAGQLMAAWQDEDFDASQGAFYYVRAIQNPTCRWSTWDALRAGVAPRPDLPATIQERAYSSPIWFVP